MCSFWYHAHLFNLYKLFASSLKSSHEHVWNDFSVFRPLLFKFQFKFNQLLDYFYVRESLNLCHRKAKEKQGFDIKYLIISCLYLFFVNISRPWNSTLKPCGHSPQGRWPKWAVATVKCATSRIVYRSIKMLATVAISVTLSRFHCWGFPKPFISRATSHQSHDHSQNPIPEDLTIHNL